MQPDRSGLSATKKAVVLFAAVAAILLAVLIWSERQRLQENQRIHDANLVKAEQFKREFDQHVTKGATLEAVEDYLRIRHVKSSRSLGFDDGRTVVSEVRVENRGRRQSFLWLRSVLRRHRCDFRRAEASKRPRIVVEFRLRVGGASQSGRFAHDTRRFLMADAKGI
jgi:hypothetical protein